MSTSSPVSSATAPRISRAPWTTLVVIASVSGAVPALWNLTLLEGLHRSAFLVVYFVLSAGLSFAGGALVVTLRSQLKPAEIIFLGLVAAGVEAFIEAVIVQRITINGAQLVLATEDYIAWAAVVLTFSAGGLLVLLRRMRNSEAGSTDPDVISRRDMLQFSTKLMTIVGSLLSLYVTMKKGS